MYTQPFSGCQHHGEVPVYMSSGDEWGDWAGMMYDGQKFSV